MCPIEATVMTGMEDIIAVIICVIGNVFKASIGGITSK
jgi:hypothetical protein